MLAVSLTRFVFTGHNGRTAPMACGTISRTMNVKHLRWVREARTYVHTYVRTYVRLTAWRLELAGELPRWRVVQHIQLNGRHRKCFLRRLVCANLRVIANFNSTRRFRIQPRDFSLPCQGEFYLNICAPLFSVTSVFITFYWVTF